MRSGSQSDDTQTRHVAKAPTLDEEREPRAGRKFGRYLIIGEVGRGGMGVVLRAYDPKLQREVALKCLHERGVPTEMRIRLVQEAQAMAKLNHPNVVSVYDLEEIEDRFVLAMEYVDGGTLKGWLEAQHSTKEVLDVFRAAGRGLSAAHRAGLLHRDFKPSNVLMTRDGEVKVTDFGLVRFERDSTTGGDGEDTDDGFESRSSGLTRDGVVMGTPLYMAPEQHAGTQVTTAADQYAFCVSLWFALTGLHPHPMRDPNNRASLFARKRGEIPPWPKLERPVPRSICEAVRRGLAPNPEERWPSLDSLLEALAFDPSRRRNQLLLGAGGIMMLGLGGATLEAWADTRDERCTGASEHLAGVWDEERKRTVGVAMTKVDAEYSRVAWTRTEAALDAHARQWTSMHTETCEATTIRGDQSTQVMNLRMACLHRARTELAAVVRQLEDADIEVIENAHKLTSGLPSLSKCEDVEALLRDIDPPREEEAKAVESIRSDLARAKAARMAGRYDRAMEAVDAAKRGAASVSYEPIEGEVALEEGLCLRKLGKFSEAEARLDDALGRASKHRQLDLMREAAMTLMMVLGVDQAREADGLRYAKLAQGLSHGQPESEASVANVLGAILATGGRYEEAEREIRHVLEVRETTLGDRHPDTSTSRVTLGNLLDAQGRHEEAETILLRAIAALERELGARHPEVATSRNALAGVYFGLGRYEDAEAQLRQILDILEATLDPAHPRLAGMRTNLVAVLRAQGQYDDAEAEQRSALLSLERALGAEHPRLGIARTFLASVVEDQGRYAEAESEYRRALEVLEKTLPAGHPDIADARNALGNLLLTMEQPAEARSILEPARTFHESKDISPEKRARTAFLLARAVWDSDAEPGDRAKAVELAEQALELHADSSRPDPGWVAHVRQWVETHLPD